MWVVGLAPDKIGSYEELMMEMSRNSRKMGFSMTFVFTGEPIRELKDMLNSAGAKTITLPVNNRFNILAIMKLRGVIIKEKITILHSNFAIANSLSFFAVFLSKVPIYFWHQHNFMGTGASLLRWLYLRTLGATAKRVIVISEAMKKNLISAGLKEQKIEKIYNGINVDKFNVTNEKRKELENEFGITKKTFVLALIGDSRPEKGHIFLLRAFAMLNRQFPESLLLFVGGKVGQCYEELKNEAENTGLRDKVIFTEMRNDIPYILQLSNIVVVPPTIEVSLYSIMEAMAASKPVIASSVGGIPEIVKDKITGILVPPGDIGILKEEILNLINNPSLREKMGSEAFRLANDRFNLKRQAKEILELYESFIN